MSIPPRFLDEIRSRVAVSEIVGRSVKLTRAGREFKGCCPFHHEKTPSFTVNDDKHFYHCFGCGAHGDVISFLQQKQNMSFIEAVEMLSTMAGLQMPKSTPEEVERSKKAKDLYDLMEAATGFFQQQLNDHANREILEYTKSRGLVDKDFQIFRIGYAPDDPQALRRYLKAQGYADKDMMEAGVIKPSSKGTEPYAFFRDRVMFPVSDRRGQIVAFGGRALPDHMRPPNQSSFKPPKYINSGDTVLFDKGRMLYGAAQARLASGEGKPVIVTEGYMDVIACHRAGFNGAVAPMGTALTEEQIVALWKMIAANEKVPVLCFDGDNAGRKAAARGIERILPLLKPHHSARIAFLPDGQDPDSLIRSGGSEAFQKILDGAISLLEFLWMTHTAGRDFSTPESRAGVSQEIKAMVSTIGDPDVQRHYHAAVQEKINAAFFARPQQQNNNKGRQQGNFKGGFKPILPSVKPRSPAFADLGPRVLIAAVINHPHIYESVEEEFGLVECVNDRLGSLRQAVAGYFNGAQELDKDGLLHHLTRRGFEKETGDILSETVYVHAAFARPQADSGLVLGQWQEFYNSLKGRLAQQETKDGWKRALEDEEISKSA